MCQGCLAGQLVETSDLTFLGGNFPLRSRVRPRSHPLASLPQTGRRARAKVCLFPPAGIGRPGCGHAHRSPCDPGGLAMLPPPLLPPKGPIWLRFTFVASAPTAPSTPPAPRAPPTSCTCPCPPSSWNAAALHPPPGASLSFLRRCPRPRPWHRARPLLASRPNGGTLSVSSLSFASCHRRSTLGRGWLRVLVPHPRVWLRDWREPRDVPAPLPV